jgi:hypothetical protein
MTEPVIHVYPNGTPTDEELEAERDADHLKAVAQYLSRPIHDEWPVGEVRG